jgi:hypothetical protein
LGKLEGQVEETRGGVKVGEARSKGKHSDKRRQTNRKKGRRTYTKFKTEDIQGIHMKKGGGGLDKTGRSYSGLRIDKKG